MANTTFGTNDALAVKAWSKMLGREALKATPIAPLIGQNSNSIIQEKTELKKGTGDKVTFGLRMQLTGDGFTEGEIAEGNGESLTIYSDSVTINELGHVVGVKSDRSIDQQRVPFGLREEARVGLTDWYAKRLSVSFFNQVCGYTAQTNTKYTGLQSATAPTSNRVIRAGSQANDQSLTSSDTFTIDLIDKAKEKAETASPKIRPVMIDGGEHYVIYLHPYQVTSLRTTTSTGQWLDIQKAAMQGGQTTGNPIFSGALGMYNNVVIRKADDIPQGVNSSTAAAVSNTRRAVFLGAQSAVVAFGRDGDASRFRWNEELLDHKRNLEVSAFTIFGMKKTVFNSEDFGTIVVGTYAAAAS